MYNLLPLSCLPYSHFFRPPLGWRGSESFPFPTRRWKFWPFADSSSASGCWLLTGTISWFRGCRSCSWMCVMIILEISESLHNKNEPGSSCRAWTEELQKKSNQTLTLSCKVSTQRTPITIWGPAVPFSRETFSVTIINLSEENVEINLPEPLPSLPVGLGI